MGLVYHNGRFIPEQHIEKSTQEARVLRLLRSFLDANEPELVRILVNTWQSQGKAITYKELREAILAGDLTTDLFQDWQQDYTRFVDRYLRPALERAIAASVAELERQYAGWHFDAMRSSVRAWTADHAAAFVTNVTTTQIEGLRTIVRRAAVLNDLSVDELARVVRPCVGLTKQQAAANLRYYEKLRANGVSEKRAHDLSLRYAGRQHRHRGYTIARTELATGYNTGAYEGTKQAQEAGYIGEVVKVWCTAEDERTCTAICAPLEGTEVAMDEEFPGISSSWSTHLTAPAHPGCRCSCLYIPVEQKKRQD